MLPTPAETGDIMQDATGQGVKLQQGQQRDRRIKRPPKDDACTLVPSGVMRRCRRQGASRHSQN